MDKTQCKNTSITDLPFLSTAIIENNRKLWQLWPFGGMWIKSINHHFHHVNTPKFSTTHTLNHIINLSISNHVNKSNISSTSSILKELIHSAILGEKTIFNIYK